MADNTSLNGGGFGLVIAALFAVLAVVFLFNGGDRFFGKKVVESDKDLPPVHTTQPPANTPLPQTRQ
jgi:hypothetical protein